MRRAERNRIDMRIKRNVGSTERALRLGAGIAASAAALFLPELRGLRLPLAIVGAAGLLTGGTRFCPINEALGVDNYVRGIERQILRERRARELQPSPGISQH